MSWSSSVSNYLLELRQLGREQFLLSYPHPVLVHHFEADAARAPARLVAFAREADKFRTDLAPTGRGRGVLLGDASDVTALVHPVRKRPGNHYPDTVTLGRADSNDVVVRYDDLSKLHAYFTRSAEGAILVADGGSSNGTWLAGERLPPNESRRLAERDQLTFGDHAFELFLPHAFAAWLGSFPAGGD